jgi:hypothetical protein
MKNKYAVALCALVALGSAGCTVDDLLTDATYDDSTGDYYPTDDNPSYQPPEYIPPIPPECVISASCDELIFSGHWESASVNVTIQNTSPDEAAKEVHCVVTMKNGSDIVASSDLDFDTISPASGKTMGASVTANYVQSMCTQFECTVTWRDKYGKIYSAQKSVRVYV